MRISLESVTGSFLLCIFGKKTWVGIQDGDFIFKNGYNSFIVKSSLLKLDRGRSMCGSIFTFPIPGKCFKHEITPPSCKPSTNLDANSTTMFLLSEKLLIPIAEFKGLLFISTTGA